jgi:L-serine dehydratase
MNAGLDRIFAAMEACIDRGMREDGILPGGLST